jgi:DNA-binding transcriptional regulator YiaG
MEERLSTSEIAEIYNVNIYTVRRWLKYYGASIDSKRRRRSWRENIRKSILELWKNPEYRRRMSEARKGRVPWNKGKHGWMTREGQEKLRKINLGKIPKNRKVFTSKDEFEKMYWKEEKTLAEIAKALNVAVATVLQWFKKFGIPRRPQGVRPDRVVLQATKKRLQTIRKDPTFRYKLIKNVQRMLKRRPTKPEQKLLEIIRKNNLPYTYVGNGSFWIGPLNPDFVNNNGEKVAVELFGDYWHRIKQSIPFHQQIEGRRQILQRYGWTLKVIWEHELNKLPEEEIVRRLME